MTPPDSIDVLSERRRRVKKPRARFPHLRKIAEDDYFDSPLSLVDGSTRFRYVNELNVFNDQMTRRILASRR